jgi:hypothetical protein
MWRLWERADRQMSGDMAALSASGRRELRDERQRAQIRAKELGKEMQIRNCAKRRELCGEPATGSEGAEIYVLGAKVVYGNYEHGVLGSRHGRRRLFD